VTRFELLLAVVDRGGGRRTGSGSSEDGSGGAGRMRLVTARDAEPDTSKRLDRDNGRQQREREIIDAIDTSKLTEMAKM
jgi:hypothetical protein